MTKFLQILQHYWTQSSCAINNYNLIILQFMFWTNNFKVNIICWTFILPSNVICCPEYVVDQNRKIPRISLQSIATAAATVNINFVCQHFWRQLCGGARATARLKLCKKGIADGESENKKSDSELESKKKVKYIIFYANHVGGPGWNCVGKVLQACTRAHCGFPSPWILE